MIVKDIYNKLDEISPFELQEKWDNSGLLVGSFDDEVSQVYISMDMDEDLVESFEENSLVITHHPLIFSGLKKVNYDTYSTKILKTLIQKNIALISMHTNIDKTHLNKYVLKDILGFEVKEESDFNILAKVDMTFEDLVRYVNKKLSLKVLKAVKCKDFIQTISICTGSGMGLLDEVKADCFLTGDIKYHDAMEAKARGISLIDIRHYESERYFNSLIMGLLEEYLKINKIKAIMSNSKNPFEFFIEGETIE